MGTRRKLSRIPFPGPVERSLDAALDKALAIQRPAVVAYVRRVRRRKPLASPAEVIDQLEKLYRAAVVSTGAAAGGAAALPGLGTAAALAAGTAEVGAFVSTTALFVLAVAEVHGIPVDDPDIRRALVLTIMLGDVGAAALAGEHVEGKHWARVLGRTDSKEQAKGLSSTITHLALTKFGAKQGALLFGRALPFGIGAGIGAAGNAALGRVVVDTARRAFGPPPVRFRPTVVDGTPADAHPGNWSGAPARRVEADSDPVEGTG
jgi:hypothetical protein